MIDGLLMEPIEPSDLMKGEFHRTVRDSNGRPSLDPRVTVEVDRSGYTVNIASDEVDDATGQHIVTDTWISLETDGTLSRDSESMPAAARLASDIRAHTVNPQPSRHKAEIASYRSAGCSQQEAEMMVLEELLSRSSGVEAAAKLVDYLRSKPEPEAVDAFQLAEAIQRARDSHPILPQ